MRYKFTHPSKMRHRVVYQRQATDTLDSYGQPSAEWEDVTPAMARIQTLAGMEVQAANKWHAEATHLVTHRFTPSIGVRDRINFNGRIFAVVHIDNYEQLNREQRVQCTELVKT